MRDCMALQQRFKHFLSTRPAVIYFRAASTLLYHSRNCLWSDGISRLHRPAPLPQDGYASAPAESDTGFLRYHRLQKTGEPVFAVARLARIIISQMQNTAQTGADAGCYKPFLHPWRKRQYKPLFCAARNPCGKRSKNQYPAQGGQKHGNPPRGSNRNGGVIDCGGPGVRLRQ